MAETHHAEEAKSADALPGMSFSWGVRFSPHVIIIILTLLAAIVPLKGAIVSGVYW
jgi:hypothetical protein